MTYKKYDIGDYIKIQEYVINYKHNKRELSIYIVTLFKDFLYKFVNLIKDGILEKNDPSLRNFVALFNSILYNSAQYNHKKPANYKLSMTVTFVQQLFDKYSYKEIYQELVVVLLSMADKYYDYEKTSFHTYVIRCFHYFAFKRLTKLIKDPLIRANVLSLNDDILIIAKKDMYMDPYYNDEQIDKDIALKKAVIKDDEKESSIYDDRILNENWINGITCTGVFKKLTPFERRILILHNVKKMKDEDIAKSFGFCRATINRQRRKAIKKLKEALDNER